jgi:hypothetical protein
MITRRGDLNGNCLLNDEKGQPSNSKGTTDIHEPSKRPSTSSSYENKQGTLQPKQGTFQPIRPVIRHSRCANSEIEMLWRYEHPAIRIAIGSASTTLHVGSMSTPTN